MDGFSVDVDSLTPVEWDRIIGDFDDLNLFQTASFADGLRGEACMSHLLLRRDGIPVAGARVAIMKPPGFPFGVAYVKHGPFWRRSGLAPDQRIYEAIVAAIVGEYGGRRGHLITISPRPHPQFRPLEENLLHDAGFVAQSRLKRPITFFLVNTGLGEKALRASLSQSWRHNLKQAERHQIEICFRKPADGLPDFLALHDAMIARKKFIDREPLHVLPRMFTQLPASCCQIVTASHQGEVVAGAVIILAGDVAYYLYGASADAALELRAGYALHWRIAGWIAEQGIGWYDLGDGFGNLRQFKHGFVGKAGAALTATEFDCALTPQARLLGVAIYSARSSVGTLRSWQRWLYKTTARLRAAQDS
ncbi:MAG TPA: GNAT family N-acetyltransferase [Xanthobacteraceae bacterium]|nr:GNAT family N-acetyltransferase [Xanthobacteraceae bacterium]